MFRLIELAFYACDIEQRQVYNEFKSLPPVDLKPCCEMILEHLKQNVNSTDESIDVSCTWKCMIVNDVNENGHSEQCDIYSDYEDCQCELLATTVASQHGHVECLKYAHKNGCSWTVSTINCAAENGHLDCLVYAHENGCQWNESSPAKAAHFGHLNCVKYLYENGCPWDNLTTLFASISGNLDILKYAHENGCEWDENVIFFTLYTGQFVCWLYAIKNGCPSTNIDVIAFDENVIFFTLYTGQFVCWLYAIKNGCPSTNIDVIAFDEKYDKLEFTFRFNVPTNTIVGRIFEKIEKISKNIEIKYKKIVEYNHLDKIEEKNRNLLNT